MLEASRINLYTVEIRDEDNDLVATLHQPRHEPAPDHTRRPCDEYPHANLLIPHRCTVIS